jgi:hypothetical protein
MQLQACSHCTRFVCCYSHLTAQCGTPYLEPNHGTAAALTACGVLSNTTAAGAIEQLDEPTLICMLVLAHQHDVPRVISAATAHLKSEGLSEEGVLAICDLPALPPPLWPFLQEAVLQLLQVATEGNKKAAVGLLLGVLGDLELVWAETDGTRRTLLCQLPYTPLALLLSADELQVATEDTVLFTVANADAFKVDPAAATQAKYLQQQMQKRLLRLVRFPQLSAACLGTVVPELEGVKQAFDGSRLMYAAYACGRQVVGLEVLGDPPSWEAGPRTASSINSMTMLYEVQVESLQQAVAGRAADAAKKALDKSTSRSHRLQSLGCSYNLIWCECTRGSTANAGRQWYVVWQVHCDDDGCISVQLRLTAVFGELTPHDGADLPNPCQAPFPSAGLQVAVCGKPVTLCVDTRDGLADAGGCEAAEWLVPVCSMRGGWGAAAWAAQGLPAEGTVTAELTVSVV